MAVLEFEKNIVELESKIEELVILSSNNDVNLNEEIERLQKKLDQMKNEVYNHLSPWDKALIARHSDRPTTLDYIDIIFDSFMEFHGDRLFGDDAAIVGGIGTIDGIAVTIIGEQKGRSTKENIKRNFGMPNPEGYRKALRLMKQAEKFNRPVICFIDTPGAFCGIGAEERGEAESIAKNLMEMAALKTPIIAIIIGEGCSGGALAIGIADRVWMLENSTYSILSPEGFASILWKDSSLAKEAADVMKITAKDLKKFGIIDKIINEPLGGAHRDIDYTSNGIKNAILSELPKLVKKHKDKLLDERYNKFRNIGVIKEEQA